MQRMAGRPDKEKDNEKDNEKGNEKDNASAEVARALTCSREPSRACTSQPRTQDQTTAWRAAGMRRHKSG